MPNIMKMAGFNPRHLGNPRNPGRKGKQAIASAEISRQIRKGTPRKQAIAIGLSVASLARRR